MLEGVHVLLRKGNGNLPYMEGETPIRNWKGASHMPTIVLLERHTLESDSGSISGPCLLTLRVEASSGPNVQD
jgi:hypothetical protein